MPLLEFKLKDGSRHRLNSHRTSTAAPHGPLLVNIVAIPLPYWEAE